MKMPLLYVTSFLFLVFILSNCTNDKIPAPSINPSGEATLWTGPTISFTKTNGSDPNLEVNQDRITDNVWLTRGNEGKQFFNIKTESSSSKSNSPAGTLWAKGTIDQIDNLSFTTFRAATGKPKSAVDQDLVMYSTRDNIYVSVKIISWSSGKAGGFSYERSTR